MLSTFEHPLIRCTVLLILVFKYCISMLFIYCESKRLKVLKNGEWCNTIYCCSHALAVRISWYILFLRKYIVINPRIICCENALVFKEHIKNKLLVEFKEKFLIKRIFKKKSRIFFIFHINLCTLVTCILIKIYSYPLFSSLPENFRI